MCRIYLVVDSSPYIVGSNLHNSTANVDKKQFGFVTQVYMYFQLIKTKPELDW